MYRILVGEALGYLGPVGLESTFLSSFWFLFFSFFFYLNSLLLSSLFDPVFFSNSFRTFAVRSSQFTVSGFSFVGANGLVVNRQIRMLTLVISGAARSVDVDQVDLDISVIVTC